MRNKVYEIRISINPKNHDGNGKGRRKFIFPSNLNHVSSVHQQSFLKGVEGI